MTRSVPRSRLFLCAALAAVVTTAPAVLAQVPPIDCATQLLGSSQGQELFAVDIATGDASLVTLMVPPFLATEIEYDIAGEALWAEQGNGAPELHQIDPVTGASLGFVTHDIGALTGLETVDGVLYGTFIAGGGGSIPSDLVVVDTDTGALALIGPTGFGPVSGLAYDVLNGVMYGITGGADPARLVTIDLATGAATLIGDTGLFGIGSIEFGADGALYGGFSQNGSDPGFLVRIDPASGAVTQIADTGFSITGLAACQEPEPAAPVVEIPTLSGLGLALLVSILAAAGVLGLRRRRI